MKNKEISIRVLLVDDHPHGREGMRDILSADSSFEIVGEAMSGEEAVALVEYLEPDLILMDIRMPGIGGLEATQRIKASSPAAKIVMVTVSDDITDLFEAIRRGAQGYLLKNLMPSAWLEYLRAVAIDETPMSKELAGRLLQEFTGSTSAVGTQTAEKAITPPQPDKHAANRRTAATPLTDREKEILERVAYGDSNKEIGAKLGISENTVKNHLKNILQKLHLDNRVQLARYAHEQGI
ncbi:two component transcriptional regulator, LuxR family [Paenibacillus curdlanolyticus YK9]|uniref:Two component transcriptional regulator, LuxR family n=1 Tax=Paenibacillus curdlanolyticus YK9 TaxID=717606 RepID=E0I6H7_9BACL|nr:response regulator transcription factor [Paenibacillus curdlanolyticus]EFM11643.1 two component transcriptional regulator, LuxR family [Paenibacillus curdlanolyticus YK9]